MTRLKKKEHKKESGESWAVSYVDMLTLLLCFFIIFFHQDEIVESSQESTIDLVMQSFDGKKQDRSPASVPEGFGPGGRGKNPPMEIFSEIDLRKGWDIKREKKSLVVDFPEISFFDSGKTGLTPQGKTAVMRVIKLLEPYKDKIKVTIQGHTDTRKVGDHRTVADNWELSVLRATSSLRLFIQEGFAPTRVSAEGFADTLTRKMSKADLAKQRKITLKVEEMRNEKI